MSSTFSFLLLLLSSDDVSLPRLLEPLGDFLREPLVNFFGELPWLKLFASFFLFFSLCLFFFRRLVPSPSDGSCGVSSGPADCDDSAP